MSKQGGYAVGLSIVGVVSVAAIAYFAFQKDWQSVVFVFYCFAVSAVVLGLEYAIRKIFTRR